MLSFSKLSELLVMENNKYLGITSSGETLEKTFMDSKLINIRSLSKIVVSICYGLLYDMRIQLEDSVLTKNSQIWPKINGFAQESVPDSVEFAIRKITPDIA